MNGLPASMVPYLDPGSEQHNYLNIYKRRFQKQQTPVNLLYDVSALQVSLITLGRLGESTRLAREVEVFLLAAL